MSVIYNSTLRTNRLNLVLNALNTGTAPTISTAAVSAGKLVIKTSGGTTLCTINLASPAGSVTGDTFTLTAGVSATAAATGTAALAELQNNASTVIVSGLTVGTSGSDITISSTSITSGQTVTLTAGTITHPNT